MAQQQLVRNLVVLGAARDQPEHFEFAHGQPLFSANGIRVLVVLTTDAIDKHPAEARSDVGLPAHQRFDCGHQMICGDVPQYVAGRAREDARDHIGFRLGANQHQDRGADACVFQLIHYRDAIKPGPVQADHDHVGRELRRKADEPTQFTGFADDLDAIRLEQQPKPAAEQELGIR